MSFEQGLNSPSKVWIIALGAVLLFGSWIAALWVFWSNPLGSKNVYVWTAVFIFITPQIINIINNLNLISPIVASSYIDDDLRNESLSSNFASIIYSTIYFLFPFVLLQTEFMDKFNWLPSLWLLALIPLILFVFFAIIPFFLGVYKYNNQKKYFLEWRQNWLKEYKSILQFPNENHKKEKEEEVQKEIDNQISDSKMYGFLNGQIDELVNNASDSEKQIIKILIDNSKDIKKWDLQLSNIIKLEEIRETLNYVKDSETIIKNFDSKLEEIKNTYKRNKQREE